MENPCSGEIKIKDPNWAPLEQRLGNDCAGFMWMYSKDGIEYYKHIDTRRYLCLSARGDAFLLSEGILIPASFEHAYAFATGGSFQQQTCR
jgi:hypothetical protein